jgi:peptidase M49-like protein
MTNNRIFRIVVCLLALSVGGNAQKGATRPTLADRIKRFVPTDLSGNVTRLSANDRKALGKLVEAATLMDSIFIRQVWRGNAEVLRRLRTDNSPEGVERLHYFNINMGPWSKLDHDEPFVEDVPAVKPPGADYYPEEMTKEEFDSWQRPLSEEAQARATGFFTTIRRDERGRLFPRPYSEEYREFLEPAAQLLRDAAVLTENASLKNYLILRANAFLTNDYYQSDVAWMDLNSPIEPTIGPYETYMDELFGYKAAFEAFITIRDEEESAKLVKFSSYLQEIEDNLPIAKKYRNPNLGALSPICVVDEVAIGGEARAGVQTAAFNLPNDERVVREKGSKRVLLKNVQEAKFNQVLIPVAFSAIDAKQGPLVSFEPFFTHILAHELMHGLGPHTITVGDAQTTVRQEMKELASALEEAKADVSGLFALQYLIDNHILEKTLEQPMYVTYLASMFRSVRFGTNEAHGLGTAMQFNFLTEQGGFVYDQGTKTFSVNFDTIKAGVAKLTGLIMTIQAEGSYAKARELLGSYGVIKPEMQGILDRLGDIPIDIEPHFLPVE